MKHLRLLFAVFLLAGPAMAEDDSPDARGKALLAAFSDRVETVAGTFSQVVTGSDGRVKERAEGRFAIARPGRFEWVYATPYEQRIVADGTNLWLHDVDLEQVSVRAQDAALGSSPAGILGGGADALEAFEYQGAFEDGALLWVQLAALDTDSDFRAVRIGFEADTGVIAAMELGDSLSQRTLIEFTDVVLDAPVDASRFEFTPPPGADVTGTPAGMAPVGGAPAPEAPVAIVPGLG